MLDYENQVLLGAGENEEDFASFNFCIGERGLCMQRGSMCFGCPMVFTGLLLSITRRLLGHGKGRVKCIDGWSCSSSLCGRPRVASVPYRWE